MKTLRWSSIAVLEVFSETVVQRQMFFKTGVLKFFKNFTGKHLCWSLFLINSEICEFSMYIFLQNTPALRQLLMYSASTLSILAMRALILMLENSMWLRLIYFLNIISFWFVEYLFKLDGTFTLANYNLKCYKIYYMFSLPLKSAIMENSGLCIN